MEAKEYYIIDINEVSDEQVELISAFLSDIPELIGITDHNSHHSFCFESIESRKEASEIIESLHLDIEIGLRKEVQKNWNQIWEDGFEPVVVDDFCAIIAPHHDINLEVKHSIIIKPEMSFGTGHHETTYMMIQFVDEIDVPSKKVLDFGCGTGVLAILAEKEGAITVDAIDYDPLCVESTNYNKEVNQCDLLKTYLGDASSIDSKYDIILANVNRNVLIDAVEILSKSLLPNGVLVLSGLLLKDETNIISSFSQYLTFRDKKEKGQWLALRFVNDTI